MEGCTDIQCSILSGAFALPVSFLYLPVVIAIKDAKGGRLWAVLVSGILIGPVSLALWGFILHLRGAAVRSLWQGDGLAPGLEQCMVFALIVGSLTSTFMCSRCDAFPAGAPASRG
jgi:hypothetical protein